MKIVPAGEFKAKCLKLMEEVSQSGESLLVTKRGQPLVDVVPHTTGQRKLTNREIEEQILDKLAGRLLWIEDFEAPIDAGWDEMEAEWDELYR